ncbi:hypothetical protein B0I32_10516 [Nonomuraea fuscirosea]|uniref:Uncharacterized protein n=1 Tax=Nonomuraea fuscirosea TaxID=1291556 RepID=A0A2T0N359_9ACTN|nr:hypothetical protein B0I32_10516 [Nonomuraea fuscirosea]
MIRFCQAHPLQAHIPTPPHRNRHGGFSPAWRISQHAGLSRELHEHGAGNMLRNAAHATSLAKIRLPLAPSGSNSLLRVRAVSSPPPSTDADPAEVCLNRELARTPVDPRTGQNVKAAGHDNPDLVAQDAGTLLKRKRCATAIAYRIGTKPCIRLASLRHSAGSGQSSTYADRRPEEVDT